MMTNPPTGTVTFLFTDIEGSTKLWEISPDAMQIALARHDVLMRAAIREQGGYVFKTVGDAYCAAFHTALDASKASLNAQRTLHTEPWPESLALKVRMALHTGAIECRDNDYFGPPLNRVARLLSTGHGGQTLVSLAAQELMRDGLPAGAALKDLGQHRLKDLARPEQVYQITHSDLPGDFPPLKSLDNASLPNNLPQQVTSFIGREKELAEVRERLAKTRLLTLTGSGGSGKSRLSLQAAADLLEAFPDGVWLVELAPIADSNLVVSAVANVLGVKEETDKSIFSTLTESLKAKKLLLLLDNCEHVLDASAKLADALLRNCPGVQILATSREGLGIAGEATYRVPSLSLPDPKQTQTAESLSKFEAVRLFIERALQTQPGFAVTDANTPALASICHRLDGIPLAIELAAARARSLTVEDINAKLDQRFRLLTGGSRTALPRQQTLRSLIDWSYDLLNAAEKALLRRLSVFAGGWTLEAAEAVCASSEVEVWEILDLLTSLCDKSLAVAEPSGTSTRYRLLETVRQYARDRLLENGDGETYRDKHRAFFLALAEEAEPELRGTSQVAWLDRLETEHDNLRAALDFCAASAESEAGASGQSALSGLRLAWSLAWFWLMRNYLSEGREQATRALLGREAALRETDSGTANRAVARVLLVCARLMREQGDYARSLPLSEEALFLSRQSGDHKGSRDALLQLSGAAMKQGDSARARTLCEEALDAARETGNKFDAAVVLRSLGIVAGNQGCYPEAQLHHEAALALYREVGDNEGIAATLNNLAGVAFKRNDFVRGRTRYEEALTLFRAMGTKLGIALILGNMGSVAIREGNYDRAQALLEEALGIGRELGNKPGVAYTLLHLGSAAFRQGHDALARTRCEESITLFRELGFKHEVSFLISVMAALRARTENATEIDARRAALLWGAVDALNESIGAPLSPREQGEDEEDRAIARNALGDATFKAVCQEGRALTLDEAIALALRESND